MKSIVFEPEKSKERSTMTWHYGEVIIDEKSYPFSICEMYDSTTNTSTFELTWVEDTPENITDQEVISHYENIKIYGNN